MINVRQNRIFSYILNKKFSILAFSIGFILMAFLVFPQPDMLMGGGDVTDIWKTITSFRSENIYPSYVLYKGFLSVYPYIWLYEASEFFGLGSWFFIKLYQCLLFAYAVGIGLPYSISRILKINIKGYRQLILPFILFILFKSTMALTTMTVDLPSWVIFVLSVNACLKIADKNKKTGIVYYIYTGLCIGLCFCLSGQYSLSALILVIFVIIKTIPFSVIKDKSKRLMAIICTVVLLCGVVGVKSYNKHFENTIVNPMRESGEWLPTGEDWLKLGLTRFIPKYEWSISSNRGLAIIKDDLSSGFEELYPLIQSGGFSYTNKHLIKVIITHPVDFFTRWVNNFFISISMSNNCNSVTLLLISYTSLFICLYLIFKRIKKWRELFCTESLIPLAFILSIAAVIVLQVEYRYSLSIMSLIVGVGVLSDEFYNAIKQARRTMLDIIKRKKKSEGYNIPYTFLIYLIFVIICFTHYGTIMELTGSDPARILFTF